MTVDLKLNRRQAMLAGATGIAGSMLPASSREALTQAQRWNTRSCRS